MTAADFAKARHMLKLSQEQCARVFAVSYRAVQYWENEGSSGRAVPRAVAALVRLAVSGRVDLEELGA